MSAYAPVQRARGAASRAVLTLDGKLIVLVAALDNIGTTTQLLGSVSLSAGMTTVAAAGLLLMWLPSRLSQAGRHRLAPRRQADGSKVVNGLPKALWLWYLWTLLSFSWGVSTGKLGLQNIFVYSGFILAADLMSRHSSVALGKRLISALMWVVWIISLVYLISIVKYGLGTTVVLRSRGTAIEDAILSGSAVLAWRGLRLPVARFLPIVVLLAVTLSLSRMSLAICMLMAFCAFMVSGKQRRAIMSKRTLIRLFSGVAAAGGLFVYLVFNWAPLRARFFGGDQAKVGGVTINTDGRLAIWRLLWDNAWLSISHVIIGQGPAASELLVSQSINFTQAKSVADPHNDFLRMFFDFGIVGFSLFLVGMIQLAVRAYRWGRDEPAREVAMIHWAAFLATAGLLGSMITDNPVVYSFCMLPFGGLVGLSLGLARQRQLGVPLGDFTADGVDLAALEEADAARDAVATAPPGPHLAPSNRGGGPPGPPPPAPTGPRLWPSSA